MAIYYRRKRRGLGLLAGATYIIICGGIATIVYYFGSRPIGTYKEQKTEIKIVKIESISELKPQLKPESQESKFPPQIPKELEIKSPVLVLDGMPPEPDGRPIEIKREIILDFQNPDKLKTIPKNFQFRELKNAQSYENKGDRILIEGILSLNLRESKGQIQIVPTIPTMAGPETDISISRTKQMFIAQKRVVNKYLKEITLLNSEIKIIKFSLSFPGPKPLMWVKKAQKRIKNLEKNIEDIKPILEANIIYLQKIDQLGELLQNMSGKTSMIFVKG